MLLLPIAQQFGIFALKKDTANICHSFYFFALHSSSRGKIIKGITKIKGYTQGQNNQNLFSHILDFLILIKPITKN